MVAGEAVCVGDFFHCDVCFGVYVVSSGFVPLGFVDVGYAVFAFAADFVGFAVVTDGFGAHSALFADLVEGVPLLAVAEVVLCEYGIDLVFVVEVFASNGFGLDAVTFDCGVEPAERDSVFFHYLFFGHPVAEDVVFFGRAGLRDSGCGVVKVFAADADCAVGESFEFDAV